MGNKFLILMTIIGVTLGYSMYQAASLDNKLAGQDVVKTNSVLKSLPEVLLSTFPEEEKQVNISQVYKEKFLVVHFWATWCAPCAKEFPQLLELTDKLSSNSDIKFLFIAVNDDVIAIKKFLKKFPQLSKNSVILLDKENMHQKRFGTYRLPETYVFGKDKQLIRKFSGAQDWATDYFMNFFMAI